MNGYIPILTCYKGLQNVQIAPVVGLFGRRNGTIWPASACDFSVGNLCYGQLSFRFSIDLPTTVI